MATKSGLRSARVAMRKRLGQHLLTNPETVRRIVASAELAPHESVLEIGPGTGNLTVHLLAAARTVYAVELDGRLAELLASRTVRAEEAARDAALQAGKGGPPPPHRGSLRLAMGDFLRLPLPPFDALVANIPYQISSPVLRRLLSARPAPSRAVIMFQKEFAARMVARPGNRDYCRLSVNTALRADVRSLFDVPRGQFRPPPRVDSAVVLITPKPSPPDVVEEEWESFLKLAFGAKNKTLRGGWAGNKSVLARLGGLRVAGSAEPAAVRADLLAAFREALGWDAEDPNSGEGARPNGLPLDSFLALFRKLSREGFRFAPRAGQPLPAVEGEEGEGEEEGGREAVTDAAPSAVIDALFLSPQEHLARRGEGAPGGGLLSPHRGRRHVAEWGTPPGAPSRPRDARPQRPVLLYPGEGAGSDEDAAAESAMRAAAAEKGRAQRVALLAKSATRKPASPRRDVRGLEAQTPKKALSVRGPPHVLRLPGRALLRRRLPEGRVEGAQGRLPRGGGEEMDAGRSGGGGGALPHPARARGLHGPMDHGVEQSIPQFLLTV